MMFRRINFWLVILCLMHPVAAIAEITVDTESLRLQFSEQGDLLRVEACFPNCTEDDANTRVLSAGQGMLVFEQGKIQGLQIQREHIDTATILSFSDQAGQVKRRWQIPDQGWMLSVASPDAVTASLMSGVDFRPAPSSGFGYLLEQSRYLIFDESSVETIGLDETEQITRTSNGWLGFRNRFWTAMVLPEKSLSISPVTGETVEDTRMDMAVTGQDL